MSVAKRMGKTLQHKYPRTGDHLPKPKPTFLKPLHPLHEANTLIEFSKALEASLKNKQTMSHPQNGPLVKSYFDKFKIRTKNWFMASKGILEKHAQLEKTAKTSGKETIRVKELKRLREQLREILLKMEENNYLEKGFTENCLKQTEQKETK